MHTSLKKRTNEEQGFTLVELLVVILIIGVLAAIAIPAFMNQRQRANDAALTSDIKNMALSMETFLTTKEGYEYAIDHRNYPSGQYGWMIIARGSSDATFSADLSTPAPGNQFHADFPHTEISEGAAIGVVASAGSSRPGGTFCIVGNMKNSTYENNEKNSSSLFYDSIKGGLFDANDLPPNGACNSYYNSIQAGT